MSADIPLYPDAEAQLTGLDGKAFAVMRRVTEALKEAGHADAIDAFHKEAMSGNYDNLLRACTKYVNVS